MTSASQRAESGRDMGGNLTDGRPELVTEWVVRCPDGWYVGEPMASDERPSNDYEGYTHSGPSGRCEGPHRLAKRYVMRFPWEPI